MPTVLPVENAGYFMEVHTKTLRVHHDTRPGCFVVGLCNDTREGYEHRLIVDGECWAVSYEGTSERAHDWFDRIAPEVAAFLDKR